MNTLLALLRMPKVRLTALHQASSSEQAFIRTATAEALKKDEASLTEAEVNEGTQALEVFLRGAQSGLT